MAISQTTPIKNHNSYLNSCQWLDRIQEFILRIFDSLFQFFARKPLPQIRTINPIESVDDDLRDYTNQLQDEVARLKGEAIRDKEFYSREIETLVQENERLKHLNSDLFFELGQAKARLESEKRSIENSFFQELGVHSFAELKIRLVTASLLQLHLETLVPSQIDS